MPKTKNPKSEIRNPKSDLTWQQARKSGLTDAAAFLLREWRGAIFGTLLVTAGLATALLTIAARRDNNLELVKYTSIASLLIALLIVILVVPPLARAAREEVSRVNIPIELTRGGLIYIFILGVVGFAAWNTNNNLLFLVLALLIAALFVSWIASRSALNDLVVSARFPDHIFAGEPAPVLVSLHNRKRILPSYSIFIEARSLADNRRQRAAFARLSPLTRRFRRALRPKFIKSGLAYFRHVPRFTVAEQKVEQTFPARGRVTIAGFELSTRFPFGFLCRRHRLRAKNVEIIVYPKPQAADELLNMLPTAAVGRARFLRRGFGNELYALRDYQPLDDLRHIDWKASARARRLTVREFAAEDERRITIVLDRRVTLPRDAADSTDEKRAELFEKGVTQAATLVDYFIAERAEVRLLTGTDELPFGAGANHGYKCLERLALVESQEIEEAEQTSAEDFWTQIENLQMRERGFMIILTGAPQGSIPAAIWRASHVIFLSAENDRTEAAKGMTQQV